MTADQRRAINRYNARKSTGPITPEGKERTRQNALKHGLCAHTLALSSENADNIQDQFDEWIEHYQPLGPAEFALVEEIAVARLRLRRCRVREAAVLDLQVSAVSEVRCHEQVGRIRAVLVRLVTDPTALEDLKECPGGRRWMSDRWTQVGAMLVQDRYASASSWVDEGVRLLGGEIANPAGGPALAYEFRLACAGAQPAPDAQDARYIAWLLSDRAIHPDYLAQYGRVVPAPAACRDRVNQIIAAETEALREEGNDGAEDEGAGADNARLRAQVPIDSPDTKLALRYESMARAALHKALKALEVMQDARYAVEAEAETGGMPTSSWACAPTPDMPTQTWACHPEAPLPSVSRNEPELPQEPTSSAVPETGCNASTDTNPDAAKVSGWLGSRLRDPGASEPGSRRRDPSHPDAPALPVVTPARADSPPA